MGHTHHRVMAAGRRRIDRTAALRGLLAAGPAVLLLVGWHLATARPGVLEVVADGLVRFIPLDVFDFGLGLLGPLAKGLVYAGVAGGFLLAGVLAGIAAARAAPGWSAARLALLAAGGLLVVAELVVLPLFGAGAFGLAATYDPLNVQIPLIGAAALFGAMLAELRARAIRRSLPVAGSSLSRREFLADSLVVVGGGALALAGLGVFVQVLDAAGHGSSLPAASGDPFGPTPALTPVADFYTVAKDVLPPTVDGATWRLAIDGLVDRPAQLSLAELRSLPVQETVRTLECISTDIVRGDHLISNQLWRGARVSDVLASVGVQSTARFVHWQAEDGYTESLPLAVALDPLTWIAYDLGGAALPVEHGFPARVLVAGRFGMKQPKWLRRMTLSDVDLDGYWEQRGWDRDAIERTMSRIDTPAHAQQISRNQPLVVTGIAFAGDRGISRVDVSPDGGASWQQATLEDATRRPLGPLTWVRWRTSFTFRQAGAARIVVRGTDGGGAVQSGQPSSPLPSGSTGWHAVDVTVI